MLHWPYVLCQTETLSSTFSEKGFMRYGLETILLIAFCVLIVFNVSLYWTTDRQVLCHHQLLPPSGSVIITSTSARLIRDLCLVPAWFLLSLLYSVLLGCFLIHPNQNFSSPSAHVLPPPILFSVHFVLFSFNRWHREGICLAHRDIPGMALPSSLESRRVRGRARLNGSGEASSPNTVLREPPTSTLAKGKHRSNSDGFSLGTLVKVCISV